MKIVIRQEIVRVQEELILPFTQKQNYDSKIGKLVVPQETNLNPY